MTLKAFTPDTKEKPENGFYLFVRKYPANVTPVLVYRGHIYDGKAESVIDAWKNGTFIPLFEPGNRAEQPRWGGPNEE